MNESSGEKETLDSLFVVGLPRSGTSLTWALLNQHPQIWLTIETNFFEMNYPLRDQFNPNDPKDRKQFLDRLFDQIRTSQNHLGKNFVLEKDDLLRFFQNNPPDDLVDLFRAVIRQNGQKHEATIYGEKTHRHLFHVEKMRDCFPNSKFIMLIRDGRDFLASMKNYSSPDIGEKEQKRWRSLYHPINSSVMWNIYGKKMLQLKEEDDCKLIRYEKLVKSPGDTVKELCNFLEVEYQDSMLDLKFANSSHYEGNRSINASSVGKWQSELSSGEVQIFEFFNTSLMKKIRYEPSETKGFLSALTWLPGWPYQTLKAFYLNRKRAGDLKGFLRKRIQTLLRLS